MQFDESADNQVANVKANDVFEIVLPEVRTAGYRWKLKSGAGGQCTLLEEHSVPSTGVHGGAGKHSWQFRAIEPGSCEIELYYARAWESPSEPAKTFRLKVKIRP